MKLGFIGMGNMAYAILKGGHAAGFFAGSEVYAYDPNTERLAQVAAETGIRPCNSVTQVAEQADIIMLAVKPNIIESVVAEMGSALENKAVLSIASSWTTQRLKGILPASARAMFTLPNTPCMVGAGMVLGEDTYDFTPEEYEYVNAMFSSMGKLILVSPKIMNGASTVTGCGPAFFYLIMEAFADGAVMYGVPRQMAYDLVAQTAMGAGKMLLETGTHPGQLKDNVCSPGGTTIRGIRALEDAGVRSAMIDAVDAASKNA